MVTSADHTARALGKPSGDRVGWRLTELAAAPPGREAKGFPPPSGVSAAGVPRPERLSPVPPNPVA